MGSRKTAYTKARERAGAVLAIETRLRPHDNDDAKRAYATARAAELLTDTLNAYPPLTIDQYEHLITLIRERKGGV